MSKVISIPSEYVDVLDEIRRNNKCTYYEAIKIEFNNRYEILTLTTKQKKNKIRELYLKGVSIKKLTTIFNYKHERAV